MRPRISRVMAAASGQTTRPALWRRCSLQARRPGDVRQIARREVGHNPAPSVTRWSEPALRREPAMTPSSQFHPLAPGPRPGRRRRRRPGPGRRAQGAQHLQLVGLHRRRHDQEFRERDRHQGPLRQLRHQRDPAGQAGGRPQRLRHRGAVGALRQDADRRRPVPEARPRPTHELEQPRPGAAGQAGRHRPRQRASRDLDVGLCHGGHQHRQGQGRAGRPRRCRPTPGR